jgi:hypothetical protein
VGRGRGVVVASGEAAAIRCFAGRRNKAKRIVGALALRLARAHMQGCLSVAKRMAADESMKVVNQSIHSSIDMVTMASLVPRASLHMHSKQLQSRLLFPSIRNASTTPPKPRLLEKPERFNPPSHPARIRAKPRYHSPLSEHERQAQNTRRYPHMMPPEGSFMHWFLTNRGLHVWITTVLSGFRL